MKPSCVFLHPLLTFSILIFSLTGCGQTSKNESESSQETKTPLFVVTGFASEMKNISSDSLMIKWKTHELYVLNARYNDACTFFRCEGGKTIQQLDSFISVSHDQLLICGIEDLTPRLPALSIDSINFFEEQTRYPLSVSSPQMPVDTSQLTWLSITGVTAISRGSGIVADQKGSDFLIDGIRNQFTHTDLLHISNEVSFTETCAYVPKTMQFCTKCRDFELFKKLGVDIVELTGNHNRDFGKQPFIDTYNWYVENGFKMFGGGRTPSEAARPLVLEICNGYRLAFIGFNEFCPCNECADEPGEPGANRWNKTRAASVIDSLRSAGVDYIIASVQFGEVDSYQPTETQRNITRYLIDAGADLVYGAQAHQIQQFEFYKGKPIMNGLGNFLFDQIHRIGVRQSCFVHLIFYKGKLIQLRPVFTMMGTDRQLKLATPDEEKLIRQEVLKKELLYR